MTGIEERFRVDPPLEGVYRSQLCLLGLGGDKPQSMKLVGDEDGGWWFEVGPDWPVPEWRGEVRWFSKVGAEFTPGEVLPELSLEERYPQVAPFVELMYRELAANAHKGDQGAWRMMHPRQAWHEISWHAAKLAVSIKNLEAGDPGAEAKVREFAADIANGCMMLLDILDHRAGRGTLGATPIDEGAPE